MADQKDGQRWRELDAIRGIAACIVVLWHFYQSLTPESLPAWIRWSMECTPLYILISGTESVMLFFLLSGFVLSLPFHRNPNRLGYRSFLVKRIARIYLPYLAALLLAVLGNAWFHGLALNSWFMETWYHPPRLTTVLEHVLFLGNYNYYAFNTAFWSLVYEMRISVVFPFLCILVIRIGWFRAILVAVGFAVSSLILRIGGIPGQTTETFKYISFFVVGILLAPVRAANPRTSGSNAKDSAIRGNRVMRTFLFLGASSTRLSQRCLNIGWSKWLHRSWAERTISFQGLKVADIPVSRADLL